jgi:hypothetical protein
MKRNLIVIAAASATLALAACGQAEAPPEAPSAPQSLFEQIRAQSPETQLVTSYQHLAAYQQANPDSTPRCTSVRSSESRGVVPDNVAPDSVYASYPGAAVYSVQCGELRTLTAYDPREHWLVVYAPGASEVTVVNCADANGRDMCPSTVPTVATATPAAATP